MKNDGLQITMLHKRPRLFKNNLFIVFRYDTFYTGNTLTMSKLPLENFGVGL